MFNIISETDKRELENLAEEHSDVLIAFGAEMYRKGMLNGALAITIGAAIGFVTTSCCHLIAEHINQKIKKEES